MADLGALLILIAEKALQSGVDWKAVIAKEGLRAAKAKANPLVKAHLKKRSAAMAGSMDADGWTWEKAEDTAFLTAQKVPASEQAKGPLHCFSRDAIYVAFRELHVPGDGRDLWRDVVDDSVTEHLADAGLGPDSTTAQVVDATCEELVDVVL